MVFVVGLGLIGLGALVAWGGMSGRLAKMAAAMLPSGAKTTSFSQPDTGFQQLSLAGFTPSGGGSFLASTSVPSASGTGQAAIPQWQSSALSSLASGGSLSGVPAVVLAGIDQAESGGQGGAINSSGYGGFFGLGSSTKYPTGQTSPGLLMGTDPSAFETQAEIAAGEFASLLGRTGGNVYQAEQIYQGGSTEGINVLRNLGAPVTVNIGAIA